MSKPNSKSLNMSGTGATLSNVTRTNNDCLRFYFEIPKLDRTKNRDKALKNNRQKIRISGNLLIVLKRINRSRYKKKIYCFKNRYNCSQSTDLPS